MINWKLQLVPTSVFYSYKINFMCTVKLQNACHFSCLLGEDGKRTNRQLKDAEFGNKDISNLQELMDVLPNIDVSDVMEIPKVFQCDEQTLPCDHTTKFRYRVARSFPIWVARYFP